MGITKSAMKDWDVSSSSSVAPSKSSSSMKDEGETRAGMRRKRRGGCSPDETGNSPRQTFLLPICYSYYYYYLLAVILCLLPAWVSSANNQPDVYGDNTAFLGSNGNHFFVQRPFSSPPTVRPPPYFESFKSCPVMNERENWEGNLCGDLNKGEIPVNPMGQTSFQEDSNYPFELIKNKTLEFFRRALPVLKTYKALPKVARYQPAEPPHSSPSPSSSSLAPSRVKRQAVVEEASEGTEVDGGNGEGRGLLTYGYGPRVKRTHVNGNNNNNNNNNMINNISPTPQVYRRNGNNMCDNAILCKIISTMYDKLPQGVQRLVSSDTHKRLSNQFLQQFKSGAGAGGVGGGGGGIVGGIGGGGGGGGGIGGGGGGSLSQNYPNHHHHPHHHHGAGEVMTAEAASNNLVVDHQHPHNHHHNHHNANHQHVLENSIMPQTPCPSTAEYVTPVFARNHEGAWRYVVQIPREGYFTQTVEVTKCVQTSCLYLEGSCRSSPRWQSLLVAEMFYPDAAFPLNLADVNRKEKQQEQQQHPQQQSPQQQQQPVRYKRSAQDTFDGLDHVNKGLESSDKASFNKYGRHHNGTNGMRRRRRNGGNKSAGSGYYEGRFVENPNESNSINTSSSNINVTSTVASQCDGYDEIGCYQFRLFYDWFLLPGECKCWKKNLATMFQKY